MTSALLTDSPLRARLQPGERILWEGQPDKTAYMFQGAWYTIPFSLMWGGFAFFWEWSVLSTPAPFFFKLWGIPFVLMGLYMIAGRFFVAAREAGRTFYLVTDRRIVIQKGAFGRETVELPLATLPYLQVSEQRDGRGTIYFAPPAPFQSMAVAGWPLGSRQPLAPTFAQIPHAAEVHQIIEHARQQAVQPARDAATRRLP